MKNLKKYLIIGVISLCLIIGAFFGIRAYLNSNNLTIGEKKWIDDAHKSSTLLNINVISDVPVLGQNGTGVFYDFLDEFASKYDLNINKVTYKYGSSVQGLTLGAKMSVGDNDIVVYTDHYILIGDTMQSIQDVQDLTNKTINVLSRDLSYVSGYVDNSNITYVSYDNFETLLENTTGNKYAMVPMHMFLDQIMQKGYEILYHFSDVNLYYSLNLVKGDTLSNIIRKFYNTWKDNVKESYNDNLFEVMTKSLNISETEVDAMRSVTYQYGYVNNSPYEVISNSNYGGIAAIYLKGFQDFAKVDFNFTKYGNFLKFNKAISKNELDIYFGYYNIVNNYSKTSKGIPASYVVVANSENDLVVNSINSLKGKTVYVDKNSKLYPYLTSLKNVNVKTYDNVKELLRLNKKNEIILIDSNIFEYYDHNGLENYTVRFENNIDDFYGFNVKNKSALYKLFNKYVSIVDSETAINKGIHNHEKIMKSGVVLTLVAKYFIGLVVIGAVVAIIIIRKTRKITIAKKIKKDDKIRFIDQLTLLKNRNYLSENIKEWSKNTIYPQAIIVLDLNHLQSINDIEGYEAGDNQIKAAANVLMRSQLDNSDIIRTDGNEFVIYMVGYSQKQVTNYIHKLNKELKKLPFNYGAEFGYSMIIDDIKTIEDALNEAVKALKEQKELNENKN